MVYIPPLTETVIKNETHNIPCDFKIQTDNLISARQPYSDRQQKKRTCLMMIFAVPADLGVKSKESEKRDKYQDLAGELK